MIVKSSREVSVTKRYIAKDGKEFRNEKDCKEYENMLDFDKFLDKSGKANRMKNAYNEFFAAAETHFYQGEVFCYVNSKEAEEALPAYIKYKIEEAEVYFHDSLIEQAKRLLSKQPKHEYGQTLVVHYSYMSDYDCTGSCLDVTVYSEKELINALNDLKQRIDTAIEDILYEA